MKREATQPGHNKPEKPLGEKTIEDVLLHFGETKRMARRRYREFVRKGIAQETREDLQGGGLVRSAGGKKGGLLGRKKNVKRETQRYWGVGILLLRLLHARQMSVKIEEIMKYRYQN